MVRGRLWQRWWWFHMCILISKLTNLSTINMYSFSCQPDLNPLVSKQVISFAECFSVLTTFSHIQFIYFSKQLNKVARPSHFIKESPGLHEAYPPPGSP